MYNSKSLGTLQEILVPHTCHPDLSKQSSSTAISGDHPGLWNITPLTLAFTILVAKPWL